MKMSTTTSNLLSVKAVLISTSVLSAAIILSTTDISVYAPWIYNGVVSWLRPPYLYLVINCIIITIVASSKLQSTDDEVSDQTPPPITPSFPVESHQQAETVQPDFLIPTPDFSYEGVEKGSELDEIDGRRDSSSIVSDGSSASDAMNNKENECSVAVAKSVWGGADDGDSRSFVKPPVSVRFSHRRNGKASPEGRTVLGVSRQRKQDTLENTWKTITEGRAIPISRHLKKSETWHNQQQQQQENTPPPAVKTMRKAETFNDRRSATNDSAASPASGGSGKLRKEPSLSQDELNRRVEAFIKKFNEDMRLQRQESFNQYTEMVKSGKR